MKKYSTEQLLEAVSQGKTVKEIANTFCVKPSSVYARLKRMNINYKQAKLGPPFGPRNKKYYAKIIELRASGMTYAAIGKNFGVTRQCIHQTIERHG